MDTKRDVLRPRDLPDWVTLALGLWLFISPWSLHFVTASPTATSVALVTGAVVFVASLISRFSAHVAEEVIDLILGLCLIGSPWALGYAASGIPANNAIIVGVLVMLFSLFGVWDRGHGGHGATHVA